MASIFSKLRRLIRIHPAVVIGLLALSAVASQICGGAFSARATVLPPADPKSFAPWYPRKKDQANPPEVPQGNVKMTQHQASDYFYKRLFPFATIAMDDPDELPYIRERAKEFVGYAHDLGAASLRIGNIYSQDGLTLAAETMPSGQPDRALVGIYVPFWVECDREYDERYLRDRFLEAITHEVEHVRAGDWKHALTRGAKTRHEASAWARTCSDVENALIELGRQPKEKFLSTVCVQYNKFGRNPDSPAFLSYVAQFTLQ
jgi:hypothetical protein